MNNRSSVNGLYGLMTRRSSAGRLQARSQTVPVDGTRSPHTSSGTVLSWSQRRHQRIEVCACLRIPSTSWKTS